MLARFADLAALLATLANLDTAFAAPAASNGCFSLTYRTCSSSRANAATSCVTGYYLTSAGRCLPASRVPTEGAYASSDGRLVSCGNGVKTCSEAAGITACQSGYYLLADKSKCSKTCPDAFFGNASTGKCAACFSAAYKTCSSARVTAALTCATGYYLTSGRCMPASAIPAGAYGGSDGKLHSCPSGAAACTDSGVGSCKSGYTLSSSGTCVASPSCPAHAVCSPTGTVTSCKDGWLLYNGACVQSCPSQTFLYAAKNACYDQCPAQSWHYDFTYCGDHCPPQWYDNRYTCTSCGKNAVTCDYSRAITCTSDDFNIYPDATQGYHNCAFTSCPDGTYAPSYDVTSQAGCVPCAEGVKLCYPITGAILSCKAGLSYDSTAGTCVEQCPPLTYSWDNRVNPQYGTRCRACNNGDLPGWKTCGAPDGWATSCLDGFKLLQKDWGAVVCERDCPEGQYGDSDGNCQPCIYAGSATCDATGVSYTCKEGWLLQGVHCVESCSPWYWYPASDGKTCQRCEQGAFTCTESGTEFCDSGYWLSGGHCVACGEGVQGCDQEGVAFRCQDGWELQGNVCVAST
ncbi:hypothetical protein JCM10213_001768 [Rhodosporidiobolus nylandii]